MLWVQYMQYIIKNVIRAERQGNWMDHLAATSKMLNFNAATGHINYVKKVRIYLQIMINLLKHNYPWLHAQFTEHKYHAIW